MIQGMLRLAGIPIPFSVRYPQTAEILLRHEPKIEDCSSGFIKDSPIPKTVSIPEEDWKDFLEQGFADSPHMEYSLLTEYFSDAILPYNRVMIHASALFADGAAWLICGNPGAGKSTQTRLLQELCPGSFSVICGDRPVLEFLFSEQAGKNAPAITVHPSAWNGKENWFGAPKAPLAGLILLERGTENHIAAITEREAAAPTYCNMIHSGWEPDNIRRVAELTACLLNAVPIWKLCSFSVPESTRLLLETVFSK